MSSSKNTSVAVGGVTIKKIEGTREEIIELRDLLDEVLDGAYNGNKKAFKADFAAVIGNNQCYNCGHKICRELFEAVDTWANDKMQSLQDAEDFLKAIDIDEIDPSDIEGILGANDWSENSTEKDGLRLIKDSHTPVDPALDMPSKDFNSGTGTQTQPTCPTTQIG